MMYFRSLFLPSVSLSLIWGLCLVAAPFNIPSSRAQQRGDGRSGDSGKERTSGILVSKAEVLHAAHTVRVCLCHMVFAAPGIISP